MTLDYSKVWEVMNELEMVTGKVCTAREILGSAIDALESGNKEKAETLMYATDDFLEYYLKDFDEKFKTAWGETVSKVKNKEQPIKDKVKKWILPVEEIEDGDTGKQEYFITFPDDLLEQTGWKEGDELNWVDNNDGSFTLTKFPKNYNEMIAAGYTMTADGFWIKEIEPLGMSEC
jgi:antitoxin component of MazEF toxin-antitoxin module